jgi:hypothetical protein
MTRIAKQCSVLLLCLSFAACDVQNLIDISNTVLNGDVTSQEAGLGLKQALEIGIGTGATMLSQKDGYYKSAYKILLPEDVRKVTDKLKVIPGFTDVENILLQKINGAAEDAATKAKPIFVDAIRGMTFNDAMGILMGNKNAATAYLQNKTQTQLYNEFNPVIVNSLNKFNAIEYWGNLVTKYNSLPFVTKLNPRLDDYVTTSALNGLFSMVEKEERDIRANVNRRTSDLMKKVFAKQDGK